MDFTPYLEMMVRTNASDLFVTAGSPVRIKIDGNVRNVGDTVYTADMSKAAVFSLLDDEKIQVLEQHRELDFGVGLPGKGRFRINAFHQRGSLAMVIRFLSDEVPTVDGLGLPPVLKDLVMHKRGILLMVGASGCGKSTSLAAMVNHRNINSTGHILTIEDQVEYLHPHKGCIVNQRELGGDTLSYAAALKSSLREAPDVIQIGEIRDRDTMDAAIELAGTGHLAISTLHANNTYMALERVINMFPQDVHKTLFMDLALYMRAIISQRLVETVDGKRTVAIEILINTPHIADLIREGKVDAVKPAMADTKEGGMVMFDDSLLALYREGRITLKECLTNSDSAANLEAKISFG